MLEANVYLRYVFSYAEQISYIVLRAENRVSSASAIVKSLTLNHFLNCHIITYMCGSGERSRRQGTTNVASTVLVLVVQVKEG